MGEEKLSGFNFPLLVKQVVEMHHWSTKIFILLREADCALVF